MKTDGLSKTTTQTDADLREKYMLIEYYIRNHYTHFKFALIFAANKNKIYKEIKHEQFDIEDLDYAKYACELDCKQNPNMSMDQKFDSFIWFLDHVNDFSNGG